MHIVNKVTTRGALGQFIPCVNETVANMPHFDSLCLKTFKLYCSIIFTEKVQTSKFTDDFSKLTIKIFSFFVRDIWS